MPIIPDQSGSGGGVTPGHSFSPVPCPGFCPLWFARFVHVKLPANMAYQCGEDPAVVVNFAANWVQLEYGTKPEWVIGECTGKGWSGIFVNTPAPGNDGTATTRIFVCCTRENLAFPRLWVYYEDHIRPEGDPDPDIHACIENACMTTIRCECLDVPDPGLPGFCRGTATLPNVDIPLYYGACDCNLTVVGGIDEFEAKSFGHGVCDCTGIPTGLPVKLECESLGPDPPPGLFEVANGSIAYTTADSIVFPSVTGPHWEGIMNSTIDSCTWDVAMFYNPATNSLGWFFQGPNGIGCVNFCPPFSLVTSTAGSCEPFSIEATYDGGQAVLTIGTPP